MKVAIHHYPGSFSDRWISYCKENSITYKIVNALDNDIIKQLSDCDIFLWNHLHYKYRDLLIAKQLLYSLEITGKKVFPDFHTTWHYDDKIGQKYLLESINAPLVPTYVFFNKLEALEWAKKSEFPKVFKFSRGAGSQHVKLVKNRAEVIKIINQAFKKGFSQYSGLETFKERYKMYKRSNRSFFWFIRGIAYFFIKPEFSKILNKEKGYVYFQDFIPNNDSDIRIIVIGNKAFAIKRLIRTNDFRASGSGKIVHNPNQIDKRCIKIAFDISKKINSKCTAYDFVFDEKNNPLLLEISYGFSVNVYDDCPGYWDYHLIWHEGKFIPQNWIIEDLIT